MMGKKGGGVPLHGPWALIRNCFRSYVAYFFALFLGATLVISLISFDDVVQLWSPPFSDQRVGLRITDSLIPIEESSCDLFRGRWVYDNSTPPAYSGLQCSYMSDEVACDKFGRNDLNYQHWRWQPHGCNLSRFDGKKLLESLRGKRMVFVGDSLNRNQWVSMVCMVESLVDSSRKSMTYHRSLMSFKAEEFNVSIDFYWSPLLLESNCDDPYNHRMSSRIMQYGSIGKHAKQWSDADILVFNTYLWWKKPRMKVKVLYGSFEDKNNNTLEVEMIEGFELALKAWSDWLESHHNRKSQLFFVSLSPTHAWGEEWGAGSNRNCYGETEPISKPDYAGKRSDYNMMRIAEDKIAGLRSKGVDVQILNITQLSEYRKDGHPSIYRKFWDNLTEEQLANPSSYSDCTHWCLPGVPDVWNQILYTYITSRKL